MEHSGIWTWTEKKLGVTFKHQSIDLHSVAKNIGNKIVPDTFNLARKPAYLSNLSRVKLMQKILENCPDILHVEPNNSKVIINCLYLLSIVSTYKVKNRLAA